MQDEKLSDRAAVKVGQITAAMAAARFGLEEIVIHRCDECFDENLI
jgi:hypothetical protein